MKTLFRYLAAGFAASQVWANDGPFLSVPAGGIQFQKTDAVSMEREELTIGEDLIRVSYVFRNVTNEDFTTEVAFPLPIYDPGEFEGTKPAFAEFTVKVNDVEKPYRTIDRAVMVNDPGTEWPVPSRGQWAVARDVTDVVAKAGIPIGDPEKTWEKLDALTDEEEAQLIAAGVMKREENYTDLLWKVQTAYVWKQTFPANATVRVEHTYKPQKGYFAEWHLEPFYSQLNEGTLEYDKVPLFGSPEFNKHCGAILERFDVDEGVLAWAKKQRDNNKRFSLIVVDYVLTTAAYWHGPIKDFTLTIEKPEGPEPVVVSTAVTGLKKVGDRRFQVRKTDFTPDKDISVLFIHAYDQS